MPDLRSITHLKFVGVTSNFVRLLVPLDLPGCLRSSLTVCKEDKFTVLQAVGIMEIRIRLAALIAKELPKAKPGAWSWVQACELQSTEGAHETWTSLAQGILSTLIC